MASISITAKRRVIYIIMFLVTTWAALVLGAAADESSPSCPFSSPALSDDHHHHDKGDYHPHDHDHYHGHDHDDGHGHRHGNIHSPKLPEELAEEEDLARERYGLHNHHHQHDHLHSNDHHKQDVSPLVGSELEIEGIWIRAMGCSLLVSMASLICLIILPLIFFQGKPSKTVVDCLAVFGAGAMLGDAFLHQLPHAFGSHSHDVHIGSLGHAEHSHGISHTHSLEDISIGLSILLGIVLFFLIEKVVRYVEDHSNGGFTHGHQHHHHGQLKLKHDDEDTNNQLLDSKIQDTLDKPFEKEFNSQSDGRLKYDQHDVHGNLRKRISSDGVPSEGGKDMDGKIEQEIKKPPTSRMVFGYLNLFSDGVHNFTDGMALGSAFLLHGSVGGWSRTMFLLAHELPQEVGDFGILVRSGFSVFKALFFNFLSALVALAGTALALMLGKDPGQSSLIEGFTAGGFIYIAVAGVLPEMHDGKTTIRSAVIQLISLVSGMTVAVCISLAE